MDDEHELRNGSRYVTIGAWERGRREDRAERERQIDVGQQRAEERFLRLFNDHAERWVRLMQDNQGRITQLEKTIDTVQSVLDQQRGARNLLLFITGTSLAGLAISIIVFVTHL